MEDLRVCQGKANQEVRKKLSRPKMSPRHVRFTGASIIKAWRHLLSALQAPIELCADIKRLVLKAKDRDLGQPRHTDPKPAGG